MTNNWQLLLLLWLLFTLKWCAWLKTDTIPNFYHCAHLLWSLMLGFLLPLIKDGDSMAESYIRGISLAVPYSFWAAKSMVCVILPTEKVCPQIQMMHLQIHNTLLTLFSWDPNSVSCFVADIKPSFLCMIWNSNFPTISPITTLSPCAAAQLRLSIQMSMCHQKGLGSQNLRVGEEWTVLS